jgi:hypothetical protein
MEIKGYSQIIPADAKIVRGLFQEAITEEAAVYSRTGCLALAAVCSSINVLGYGIVIGARLVSSIIYVKFDKLWPHLIDDSKNVIHSLHFTAAATAFLFLSLFSDQYSLKPTCPPLDTKKITPPPVVETHPNTDTVPVYTFADPEIQNQFLAVAERWPLVAVNGFTPFHTPLKITQENLANLICIIVLPNKRFVVDKTEPTVAAYLRTAQLKTQADNPTGPLTPEQVRRTLIPPSPLKIKPTGATAKEQQLQALRSVFHATYDRAVAQHVEPPKDQLYRHYLNEVIHNYGRAFGSDTANIQRLPDTPLAKACKELIQALTTPTDFDDAGNQYVGFVAKLRQAIALLAPQSEEACRDFLHRLSYLRFTGVRIYDYAHAFVTQASGNPKPEGYNLGIGNFAAEFDAKNTKHDHLPTGLTMSPWDRRFAKMRGFFNRGFDPLHDHNIPYVDGTMTVDGQSIKILRHGVPVSHDESVAAPLARAFHKGTTWAASWVVSNPEQYIGKTALLSDLPQLNPDYLLFMRQAAANNEKILHVIFEDGDVHVTGDESGRVDLRLSLQKEENFFPLALRMDGAFFKTSSKATFTQFKADFKKQLLGDLGATGFCIPQKVRDQSGLEAKLDDLLKEVQDIYFPQAAADDWELVEGQAFKTLEEQKAYMLLSYAHIVLFLGKQLKIDILEAHCKDDIDRGNAFKIILKLHFLYLTGQINDPKQLERVLVTGLIPPVIVKRQGIIPNRFKFIHHVHAVMNAAFGKNPNPNKLVGNYRVHRADDRNQTQDLFPLGHTAKTGPEYLDFLKHLGLEASWPLPSFNGNIIDEIARGPAFADRARIEHQIRRDLPAFPSSLGGEALKSLPVDEAFAKILPYLQANGLDEDQSWKVMCSFNQALTDSTFLRLESVFSNPDLQVNVVPDNVKMMSDAEAGIHLTAKEGVASLRFVFFANVINGEGEIVKKVRATVEIPDHRTGVAQFAFSLSQS